MTESDEQLTARARLVTGAYALHTIGETSDGTRKALAVIVLHVHDATGDCADVPVAFDAAGLRRLMRGLMTSHEALTYMDEHPEVTTDDSEKVAEFIEHRLAMLRAASEIAFGGMDITEGLT